MQRSLDDHRPYATTQMTYLQEQIIALSTQIWDLASMETFGHSRKKWGVVNEGEYSLKWGRILRLSLLLL